MKVCTFWLSLGIFVGAALAQECHEPDVKASASVASLAADICAIDKLLSASPPKFKAARAVYRKGRNNLNETLEEAARFRFGCPTWKLYALAYGAFGWMDETLRDVLKGYRPFETDIARAQFIKTFLRSAFMSQRCIYHLENSGVQLVEDKATEAMQQWDYSMAAFYGADVNCAIFGDGTAVSRDFRTNDGSTADINLKIAQLYKAGRDAIDADDVDELNVAIDEIRRSIFIIHTRSLVKSTILMEQAHQEKKSFAKFQGEGLALMAAIGPVFDACGPEGVYSLEDVFDFFHYFPAKGSASVSIQEIVEDSKCLRIFEEDLGELISVIEKTSSMETSAINKSIERDSTDSEGCYDLNPWADYFS